MKHDKWSYLPMGIGTYTECLNVVTDQYIALEELLLFTRN